MGKGDIALLRTTLDNTALELRGLTWSFLMRSIFFLGSFGRTTGSAGEGGAVFGPHDTTQSHWQPSTS